MNRAWSLRHPAWLRSKSISTSSPTTLRTRMSPASSRLRRVHEYQRPGRHSVRDASCFPTGKLEKSGGPFDVAIDGTGFFIVTNGSRTAYTRNGEFHRAPNGRSKRATVGASRRPHSDDATSVSVDPDGRVHCERARGKKSDCGRIVLSMFAAPEALEPIGSARLQQRRVRVLLSACFRRRAWTENCVRGARAFERLDHRLDDGNSRCAARVRG